MRSTSLVRLAAQQISAQFCTNRSPGELLPPVAQLCEYFHLSRATILRALGCLAQQGVVSTGRGRRAKVAAQAQAVAGGSGLRSVRQSWQAVADVLRERIESGQYRAGHDLPKTLFLIHSFSVSGHTIQRALRSLEREGAVHKRGRAWVVGSRPTETSTGFSRRRSCLIIISGAAGLWASLLESSRTRAFCATFMEEAQRLGVRLVEHTVSTAQGGGEFTSTDQALSAIQNYGDQLAGALLTVSRRQYAELEALSAALRTLGAPIIWFDRYGERRLPENASGGKNELIQCRFSERRAVAAAVDHIQARGHLRIGFPVFFMGRDWSMHRAALVKEALEANRPQKDAPCFISDPLPDFPVAAPETAAAPGYADFLHELFLCSPAAVREAIAELAALCPESAEPLPEAPASIAGRIVALKAYISPLPHVIRASRHTFATAERASRTLRMLDTITSVSVRTTDNRRMIGFAPTLLRLVRHHRVTVLIAPSDRHAPTMYRWLNESGIRVPDHVSLLSFDNHPSLALTKISSVDFGFGHLGYTAFHAFLKDVPLGIDSNGVIEARPFVVDRGSVAGLRR